MALNEKVVYCQIDAHLDTNPKIRRAGRNGRDVFEFILRRVAIGRTPGTVPVKYIEPWYLADQLMMSEDDARDGTSRAVTASLIAIDDAAGVVRVVGWSAEWGRRPKEGAERTAAWRAKPSKSRERVTLGDDVSSQPSQVTVRDESDAREERRGEENTLSVPPAAPAESASGDLFGSLKAKVDAATGDVGRRRAEKPATPKQPAPHQPAIEHFDARYSEAYGCRPEWRAAGEAKQIADLTKRHGADEVIRRIDTLFDGSAELAWLKPPFTVGTLVNNWNRLVTVSTAPRVSDRIIKDM